MARPKKLTEAEIEARLKDLPEWSLVSGSIQRTFRFADFARAMRFVNLVAESAEQARHHPDILIRYDKVTLSVNTHDAGGITAKDFSLAASADRLAAEDPAHEAPAR